MTALIYYTAWYFLLLLIVMTSGSGFERIVALSALKFEISILVVHTLP